MGDSEGPGITADHRPDRRSLHGQNRAGQGDGYADVGGFCKDASLDEALRHGRVLTPGRYISVERLEDDGEPFANKMERLFAKPSDQQSGGARLDAAVTDNLAALVFGGGKA